MNFLQPDFAPAYPEIFLLIMVCVVLLADLAWGGKKPYLAYSLAQLSLIWLPAHHFRHFCARRRVYILRNVRRRRNGGYTEDAGICYGLRRISVFAGVH